MALRRYTRQEAEAAEKGFLWAIKVVDAWAPSPMWMALAKAADEVKNGWWQTVPKTQVVEYTGENECWEKGRSYVARKSPCKLPGWYTIKGITTKGEDFLFSASESMLDGN